MITPVSTTNEPLLKTLNNGKLNIMERFVGIKNLLCRLSSEDEGQDVAEYAVMLAVVLVIVVGTVQLIGANANLVFSGVASSIP
ncbi:MAG: hypothetical protein ACRD2U_02400 [Terriglobales bacterium]